MRILVSLILTILFASGVSAQNNSTMSTFNKNITGHYLFKRQNVKNQLDVLMLTSNKIRFHLIALLFTGSDLPHNGEIVGEINITDSTAKYEEGNCTITFKFSRNKVQVFESNIDDCGFGAFVTAEGTYRKTSNAPNFNK
jgi:hypothetical protein